MDVEDLKLSFETSFSSAKDTGFWKWGEQGNSLRKRERTAQLFAFITVNSPPKKVNAHILLQASANVVERARIM